MSAPRADDLLERLRAEPGGEELLAIAPADAFLVGGAVRDLLLDRTPRELDVVVESDRSAFGHAACVLAAALAARLDAGAKLDERSVQLRAGGRSGGGGERCSGAARDLRGRAAAIDLPGHAAAIDRHERFGTAIVAWGGGRIDIATARREHYPARGALPEVEPAPLAEDLLRRDFTVNALALALAGKCAGELREAPRALEDLRAGRLRVLHERSFLDDPTRLWRLARYRARLGFEVEERTSRLAAAAIADGALRTVSGARIGAELRLALDEADPLAALAALDDLGVLVALHPRLRFDSPLAREALGLLLAAEGGAGPGPRPDLLLLAALLQPLARGSREGVAGDICELLDGMEFSAADRELVVRAATRADALAGELADAQTGSEIYEVASRESLEGVALAGSLRGRRHSAAGAAAHRWLTDLRNVRLEMTGDDLLAAGVPEGPEVGRRLRAALCAKLDGELADGRAAELAAALERDRV